jgi:hypothetical protein
MPGFLGQGVDHGLVKTATQVSMAWPQQARMGMGTV